jgi:hypothetical protein
VRTISHYQCHSVGLHSPVIYSSFIFLFFFCPLSSSLDLNPPSELPIIKLIKICSIFDGGGNWSARRKPPVRRKFLLYGTTYLVPRAGIEPTPRTDIGYKRVSQTFHRLHFFFKYNYCCAMCCINFYIIFQARDMASVAESSQFSQYFKIFLLNSQTAFHLS